MGSVTFDIFARDHASKVFKNVGSSADGLKGKLSGFKSGLKDALTPANIASGAAAGAAVVAFGASSIQAFSDAQEASTRLQNAFDKFPALADSSKKAFETQASALQKKTKFDDESIKTGQAQLAQFKLTGTQIKQLTPLMLDYAAKTGKDLPTAATDLGKAILGQGRALKGIGINFKDTGSAAGNFEQLVVGLRQQVGGLAEKEGNTASGKMAILRNQFGELQEKIGEKLLPVLVRFADWLLNSGIPAAEKIAHKIGDFIQKVHDLGVRVGEVVSDIKQKFDSIVDFFKGLPDRISKAVHGMFDGIKNAFKSAINWIIDKWNDLEFKIGGQKIFGKTLPSVTIGTPNIPKLANGGIVTSPTLALIGEAGPEAVVPLGGSARFGTHVVMNNDMRGIQDPMAVADLSSRLLGWRLSVSGARL
jgi:hypothetical protein